MSVTTTDSLLVCTQPRSGSYLLCDLLGASGALPRPDEWLTEVYQKALTIEFGLPRQIDRVSFLRELVRRKTSPEGWFTVKVMGWNFWALLKELASCPEYAGAGPLEIVQDLFPRPRFLYLEREDQLAQAVSFARAQQTDQWRGPQRTAGTALPGPLTYSFAQIHRGLRSIERSARGWRYFFATHAVHPFELRYEDLTAAPEPALHRLHQWLGLEAPGIAAAVAECCARGPQRDALNRHWARRYEQEQSFLQAHAPAPAPELAAGQFRLELPCPELVLPAKTSGELTIEVTNEGDGPWMGAPPDAEDEEGWVLLHADLPGAGGLNPETPFLCDNLPAPLQAGESRILRVPVPPTELAGKHTLELAVVQRRGGRFHRLSEPAHLRLEVTEAAARTAARAVFPDLDPIYPRKCDVAWFGQFFEHEWPWIYHDAHEWIEIDPLGSDADRLRVFDPTLGWVRIERGESRRWEHENTRAVLTFLGREGDWRQFRNEATGAIERFPTNDAETAQRSLAYR